MKVCYSTLNHICILKKISILLIAVLTVTQTFSQQKEEAHKLVDQGITLHDNGKFDEAIAVYDKALELDADNLRALSEKALTLESKQKYDDAIACCKRAISKHSGDPNLGVAYVIYGNILDQLKRQAEAIAIYEEGIKVAPDFYSLHFNRGIALSGTGKYQDAILSFEEAVKLDPAHAGSHNGVARLSKALGRRIPAILAFARFLSLEPQTERAQYNLQSLQYLMKSSNVSENEKGNVTIQIDASMLGDKKGAKKPDDFSSVDMILSMTTALDSDKENKNKTPIENFIRKFSSICGMLGETAKDNSGFYWTYYAPYFAEMKSKNFVETFAHIAFSSSDSADVAKWLKEHGDEVDKFYAWSDGYAWTSK